MARRAAKKVVLVVIDGLTPGMLERGIGESRVPALSHLVAQGTYRRGVTTFPSVTPVCLTTIATGAHPDVHHVPHLSWYHRGERRIIEYGSSFHAMRAAGARQAIRDAVFNMSHSHVNPRATTVFEAVEDAGRVPAAINFTCYRGRTRHPIRLPGVAARNRWFEAAYGPKRFFFFNLFESDPTGAPLAVRSRVEGSTDAYAGYVGRWLVTRDGFDFLVFYLPDFDYASHLAGPASPLDALSRADASVGQLMDAAGGPDELLERYAVVVCADHGQTHVDKVASLHDSFSDLRVLRGRRDEPEAADVVVTASNRSGMVYRLPACGATARELAERLDAEPAADVILFREGAYAVARRGGDELRFAPEEGSWRTEGDCDLVEASAYPDGLERAWRALACPNAGEVIVSAAQGYELTDLGGRHHLGGGSHGSLGAGDSVVPIIAAGLDDEALGERPSLTELAPLVLSTLGVDVPASMARHPEAVCA